MLEIGTGGALGTCSGPVPWLTRRSAPGPARAPGPLDRRDEAAELRDATAADVGLAVSPGARGTRYGRDGRDPSRRDRRRRTLVFLAGDQGRSRRRRRGRHPARRARRPVARPADPRAARLRGGRLAAGGPLEPGQVDDDDRVPLEPDAARRRRTGRAACSRSGGSRRSSRRGRPGCTTVEPDVAVASGCPGSAGEAEQPGGHAAGHVEEVELLDVGRSGGGARRPGPPAARRGWPARVSISWRNRSRGRTRVSVGSRADRGGRARRAVEQRQLAEEAPGRTVARMASSPSSDGRQDLDRARGDDEQRIARIALVEQDLASPEAPGPQPRGEALQAGRVQPREELAPARAPRSRTPPRP